MRIKTLLSIPYILMVSTITSDMTKHFSITLFYTFSLSVSLDNLLGTRHISFKFGIRYK